MWQEWNPNPKGRRVGDCAIRAVARALGVSWEDAFALLAVNAFAAADMPSSDAVIGAALRQHGFVREAIPNTCPDCYTAEDFCKEHPEGIYLLFYGGHVACIEDGTVYDSWDSSSLIPQYFYHKERKDD